MADPSLLVTELAGAVADGEWVDWAEVDRRVARDSAAASTISNLKVVDQLRRSRRSSSTLPRARPKVSPLLLVLMVPVLLQVATAGLGALLGVAGPPGIPGWLLLLTMVAFSAGGVVVAVAGRWDPRTAPLSGLFLGVASASAQPLLSGVAQVVPAVQALLACLVECFIPFFLWQFVRQFPRVVRLEPGAAWTRALSWTSLAVGCLLLLVNGLDRLLPGTQLAGGSVLLRAPTSGYWLLLFALSLPAPFVAYARSRYAAREEQRRVRVFLLGLAVGVLPLLLAVLAEVLIPAWATVMRVPRNRMIGSFVVYGFLLTVPVTLTYGAVVRHVLELPLVVHRAAQAALARGTLWVVSGAPLLLLGSVLWRNRRLPLAEIVTTRPTPLLLAAAVTGTLLMMVRPSLLAGVERTLLGRRAAPSQLLAELARSLAATRDVRELAAALNRHTTDLVEPESCYLLLDTGRGSGDDLVSVDPRCRSLEQHSALVRLAQAAPDPMSLDPRDDDSWLPWLPEPERLWAADTQARLVVPLQLRGTGCGGLLVLGPSRSGASYRLEDRQLAAAFGSAVSLALDRLGGLGSAGIGVEPTVDGDRPAGECHSCRRVAARPGKPCACGAQLTPAVIPFCLAGKFELQGILGEGGMGRVYLARDLTLDRAVALKTLPRLRSDGLLRLRREARSMASFVHPNLALIFGAETWRGVPVLVVEHLAGGTLAGQLATGANPLEVVDLGVTLAGALAALHAKGMLHRDVKPANIGFTAEGVPKLLDFGLVQMLEEAEVELLAPAGQLGDPHSARERARLTRTDHVVGTPFYLSPQLLQGGKPSPAQDLWSLAVVLWEALAGRHPLRHLTFEEALGEIVLGKVPHLLDARPDCPQPLADLVMRGLAQDPASRPESARALQRQLEAVRRQLV